MSIDLQKNRSDILEAYDDVLNDKSSTDWILLGYEGQTNVLKLVGTGDGGLEELADDLNSSKVMYAVVRVTDPKTTRTKLVLINWIGEGAPTLRKGVCARHLPEVKDMFRGVNVTVNARNEEEVEADQVYAALGRATATSYDFSERSDHEEKNNPVGTNYQRTNPLSEINTNSRNLFWEQQEQEERRRKQEEMKRKQEESEMLEKERKKKEVESSSVRDAVVAQRTERIMEQRRATEVAEQRCRAASGSSSGGGEDVPDNQEVERSKRSEMMRRERKQEAESVIGHSTKSARSLFESQQHQQQPLAKSISNSSVGGGGGGDSRPPPRKLKEFTPLNQTAVNGGDVAASTASTVGGRGSVGRVWPPPSNSTGAPTLIEERKIPHRMFGSEGSPPPAHRPNQSELRNGGTATVATSSIISSSGAPSSASSSVAVGRRQDPIGGNAVPARASPSSPVSTNNTSPLQSPRQPLPSTGYVKGAETKTTPLPELPLYAQQQQQQQLRSPSRNDPPLSPVIKENVGSNYRSNEPEQSPPQTRVAEGEAANKDKTYESSDERFSLSAQHHQKQQRKQQHSSPVQEDEHRYEGIQSNNPGAVYNTNNNSVPPCFSTPADSAIHSSPEPSRTSQLPPQHIQQEPTPAPPPLSSSSLASQQQDRQSVGGYLPSDVRTNGAAAASAATSVGRVTSNGGSNNQSHLYDDVPGDDDSDRIYDSPYDGVKAGMVTVAEDALSPGPASPRVESTPSVAMTCEVDGIEYQLLPEHGLCARALYDYQASDDTEISFDPSEIISNIEQIDEGWWQGVGPNGDFGLFPANYVELISAAAPPAAS